MSSSSTVEQALEAAHEAKAEKLRVGWEAYHSILVDLAEGRDVDPVELNLTLEMIGGRSDSQVKADVEKMQKRIGYFREFSELAERTKAVQQAQAANDAAKAEYDRIAAELDAKCKAAYWQLQEALHKQESSMAAEGNLLNSCFSPVIEFAKSQIEKKRRPIVAEMQRIHENHLDEAEKHTDAWNLRQTQRQIREADEQLKQAAEMQWRDGLPSKETYLQRKELAKRLQQTVSEWQAKYDDLQRQLDELSRESLELRKQKLQP